jgi:hypothetical protein
MSLNSDFSANPAKFIIDHVVLVPGGINAGEGRFVLTENSAVSCLLKGSTSVSDLRGFHAEPAPNDDNVFALPVTVDFMFTDLVNGCQFVAYGPDRQHVTVEHNNYIGNPGNYATRLATITAQNHAYFFSLRHNMDYDPMQGANVLGNYTRTNGWRFWVRQRQDLDRGTLGGPF